MPRVLLTLAIGLASAVGVGLLMLREEPHFVRHILPAAALVAFAACAVTWRRTSPLDR